MFLFHFLAGSLTRLGDFTKEKLAFGRLSKAQCELKMTIPEESQEYTSHKGGAELEHANAPQNKLADSEPKHSLTQQHAPVAPGASFRTGGAARSEIYNSTLAFK